ncbi:ion channel [Trinickia caryophylli]|uniref:Inward rectifier potassium channel n=2 Tax=Trinickia caryophylli TaxID=28094 RepID=A0A1X7ELR9_TRICW|nr:ion channel [Trinickia caryophylli]PMS08850.1 Inward rectifier potassium channel [Trinickia caryophylli]WQE10415.1 ion channel [Trinickia caryophylli]GLU32762.1 inward rectifier potassium channel protein [Trinickia caryophylli]SMF36028.1 inward rectifier potassium channel [Trinickia caryophylli]
MQANTREQTGVPNEQATRRARAARAARHGHGRGRGRVVRTQTGTIVTHGMPATGMLDLYHRALTARWPTFFASLAALFLVLNAAFAGLYLLGDAPIVNQSPPGFLGAFFFSVETLATVGYGDMHPRTAYAHLIASLEIFTGMSSIALATGLIFVRFSRPRALIMFSHYAVVQPIDGKPTLMVRVANARQNVIGEAGAKLRLMRYETTPEGYRVWRIADLALVRDRHPIFLLGWNLMHVIDETSPLAGESAESLAASRASLMLHIEGADETTTQSMEARHAWSHDEIRWQHRFVDLLYDDEDGMRHIDYTHFHDVTPLDQ